MAKISFPKSSNSQFDGKTLKVVAINKGVPLWRLAQQSDISPSRVSDFINGRRVPSPETLKRLSENLGVDPSIFFSIEEM